MWLWDSLRLAGLWLARPVIVAVHARRRRLRELAEIDQILREMFAPAADPTVERTGLIPAAPLAPPAARAWREIESDLAADPELMLPVLDALREHPTT